MVEREVGLNILNIYKKAWVEQDSDLILTIFHEDGEFGEYLLDGVYKGHKEIKDYWDKKVVQEQSDIDFNLLNLFVDGDTIIAEWDVTFFSNVENKKIHLVSVGVLEVFEGKIKKHREYWHSERL